MRSRVVSRCFAICLVLFDPFVGGDTGVLAASHDRAMRLPVTAIVEPPLAYIEFCDSNPGHCDMTGSPTLKLTPEIKNLLARITREVNAAFQCVPD